MIDQFKPGTGRQDEEDHPGKIARGRYNTRIAETREKKREI